MVETLLVINAAVLTFLLLCAKKLLSAYSDQKGKNFATIEDAQRIAAETERGKNLATKEDIAHLTNVVEQIKAQHAKELESLKMKNQLRMASLDTRLKAHQEAFSLWRKLLQAAHKSEVGVIAKECEEWWEENCLYLEPAARIAFNRAYWAARDHKTILAGPNRDSAAVEAVQTNWAMVTGAGQIIMEAVALPPLTEQELKSSSPEAATTSLNSPSQSDAKA